MLKKGDNVSIISGKDKGKSGKIIDIIGERVIVEGLNKSKKHAKPSQKYPKGGIVSIEMPIHCSNVQIICPACDKKTRVQHKIIAGKNTRSCALCHEPIS